MLKKVALYVRVSTVHQIDKDSLPFQRQELVNYSKYVLGIDDYEIFEDAGYSAKNTDRPRYQEMMARIKSGEFTHLIVWKIDRISRNLKDFTQMYDDLKEYGITFISKNEQFDTSSAMGEAMLKIILVFAELERKLTAERVFSIMLSRAEKGLWNGATVPLGYVWSDEIKFPVIDEEEAKVVQYIYDLYEKHRSTSVVAFTLNEEGARSKRGGKFTAKTVNDVLRNPFYVSTYRYNAKSNGKWKDEKEWIVVEDNHPGIIELDQFNRVNGMLTENYKGTAFSRRSNIHTHIFAKMLYCDKCGMNLNSGLDSPRNDGYRPSRYTCYNNHHVRNVNSCNSFVSDIHLLPFILNYLANFINLQGKITQRHSLRDIERILLRGSVFTDIEGIDRAGLESTYVIFATGSVSSKDFKGSSVDEESHSFELEKLKKDKQKYEKALERLEDLFLYSDESMAKKDFLFKKRDIISNIERVNDEFSALHDRLNAAGSSSDISFLSKASNFLILNELSGKRHIEFKELLEIVDKSVLQEFIQSAIESISIRDKKISSITFSNGIVHKFAYKPLHKRKRHPKEKLLYLSFEPMLLDHLKEHGSVNRVEVEELTGMTRTGALSLINEFVDRGILEKRGASIAIRYFLIKKETT